MHGLVTIGTAAGTAELTVAAGACAAARAAGSAPAAFVASAAGPGAAAAAELLADAAGAAPGGVPERVFDATAPPLVAARHQGVALEPAALLDGARAMAEAADPLVVATSGGLLAPIAARYSNRDLAQELGLPVVVAATPAPDMLAATLLTIDAATGAGVAVAAVVIAGWPDAPGRVLLDERELLERQVAAPVLTLAAGTERDPEALAEAVRRWPVDEWARAAAVPPPIVEEAAPRRVTLEPYAAWDARPVGDPRSTPRAAIMETMLEIVGTEGPMTASRAYSLYNRASGGRKLTSVARAPLSSSVYWLAQERKVVLVRKEEIPWQDGDLVRMPDSPAVRVRELGPRALEEVPLDEIAELVRRLRGAHGTSDPTELKRAVLNAYGLVRLTARADEYLGLALGLADDTGGER
jgi:dethiobiotin synthetase